MTSAARVVPTHPGDRITGRIFGQYITLQRCEWEAIAEGGTDTRDRAAEIATRPADDAPAAPAPVAVPDVCGHGVPIHGEDCEECDAANAESDSWPESEQR